MAKVSPGGDLSAISVVRRARSSGLAWAYGSASASTQETGSIPSTVNASALPSRTSCATTSGAPRHSSSAVASMRVSARASSATRPPVTSSVTTRATSAVSASRCSAGAACHRRERANRVRWPLPRVELAIPEAKAARSALVSARPAASSSSSRRASASAEMSPSTARTRPSDAPSTTCAPGTWGEVSAAYTWRKRPSAALLASASCSAPTSAMPGRMAALTERSSCSHISVAKECSAPSECVRAPCQARTT